MSPQKSAGTVHMYCMQLSLGSKPSEYQVTLTLKNRKKTLELKVCFISTCSPTESNRCWTGIWSKPLIFGPNWTDSPSGRCATGGLSGSPVVVPVGMHRCWVHTDQGSGLKLLEGERKLRHSKPSFGNSLVEICL